MILDNEQQRQFLLEMFKQVNFPGQVLEIAFAVKQSLQSATVASVPVHLESVPAGIKSYAHLAEASD